MKRTALIASFILAFWFFLFPADAMAAATLSLSPASGSKSIGDTFTVDIVLNTGGDQVAAASAIINYDTSKLTATRVSQGTMFNQSPLTNTIDTTRGEIRYDSGSLGTTATGQGVVATITFRAIAAGTTQVNYVFDPTATTGTSLVAAASGPTNLLTTVNGASFTIISGGTVNPLPPTGAFEETLLIVTIGGLLIGSGIILARRYMYA